MESPWDPCLLGSDTHAKPPGKTAPFGNLSGFVKEADLGGAPQPRKQAPGNLL